MAKGKQRYFYFLGFPVFIVYVFIAAQPIPRETILVARWLSSLESNYPITVNSGDGAGDLPAQGFLPFKLGNRFGYVGENGHFIINNIKKERTRISISDENWAEYEALPASIQVFDSRNNPVLTIENPTGYPVFMDNTIYIVGNEQNSLTALDSGGEALWTYDFPAPLTCIDGAAGYVLAGTLDGTVELLNSSGRPVFPAFEPGGSRRLAIYGCAISKDASRLAVISGIDDQRFLLLERSGDTYKVVYHEFLSDGFRGEVYVSFIENDSRIAFEREGGLGLYDIASRTSIFLPLEGEIAALDNTGGSGYLFVISSVDGGPGLKRHKRFVAIRLPGTIVINAPFRSENAFLGRRGDRIYLGGDSTLASFELGEK
jgi:hypothetical protein